MKKLINKISFIAIMLMFAMSFNACEDAAPTDYIPKPFVEGYLIVGKPIEGIMVYMTQPTNVVYNRGISTVKDAQVTVTVDDQVYTLQYKDGETPGYAFGAKSVLVLPNKKYKLNIIMKDGSIVSGETLTPGTMEWIREPKPMFHYPQDTMKLPRIDSLDIEWTKVPDRSFYLVRVKALDTLEYGKYLAQPSNEMNRRTYSILEKMDDGTFYKNLTGWGFIANTQSPTVWMSFKWFGKHTVAMYCPDDNMMNWFINIGFNHSSISNNNLKSIVGGEGVFGSASMIEKEVFMFKNQP